MDNKSDISKKKYNRIAKIYDIMEIPMEFLLFAKWRKDTILSFSGEILEVGIGTGKNIKYYTEGLDVTAIDFSEKMLRKARIRNEKYNKNIKIIQMDVENLEFDNNTFDIVFTSFVFCSVPDPIKGLEEIRRVCRPGGKVIMIEHVRSEKPFVGFLMDLLNPIMFSLYGANINRKTVENVVKAGYSEYQVINLTKDIVKKIIIYNKK